MQLEFCTLFDRHYLARGLVLYRSLAAHCDEFRLRVFCMDAVTERVLRELDLPSLVPISLTELERHDRELAAVRRTRSHAEYCWTASPAICMYVLEREPDVSMVTRLDVDLEFYDDPAPLLDELGDGSVLIVPHRVSPEYLANPDSTGEEIPGVYCVQFDTFRRDAAGLAALGWWRERCIEWCYDRIEKTRHGDQWYLDEFPMRFAGVRVLKHIGGGVAPWNLARYRLERRDGRLLVDGVPVIFHHFQSLEAHAATRAIRTLAARTRAYRFTEGPVPLVWTTGWRLSEHELSTLWDPYVERLSEAMADLHEVGGESAVALPHPRARRIAFHITRRRLPGRMRTRYSLAREAILRRRGK